MNYREIARFPSSSSSKVYTVKEDEDGNLSCDCPAWRFKKPGQERNCKHTKAVAGGNVPIPSGIVGGHTVVAKPAGVSHEIHIQRKGSPTEVVVGLMAEIEEHRGVQSGASLYERLREMKE